MGFWLVGITTRMAAGAQPRRTKYHLVTSDPLYLLGIELMDRAVAQAKERREINKRMRFVFRRSDYLSACRNPAAKPQSYRLGIGQHLAKADGFGRLIYRQRTPRRDGHWIIPFPWRFRSESTEPGAIRNRIPGAANAATLTRTWAGQWFRTASISLCGNARRRPSGLA